MSTEDIETEHNNRKKLPVKYRVILFLANFVFVVGAGVLLYPTVADQWNSFRQNQLISSYQTTVSSNTEDEMHQLWEEAEDYNQKHQYSNIYAGQNGDVFSENESSDGESGFDDEYMQVLNPAGDGVKGYISIPKIDVNIPIYHGTSDEVLKKGVGHLNGSNLPIGGESNHCVLAAHRGLPNAKLFSDLNKLEIGDEFYISVLDETLAYEVDQILPMVDPNDIDTMLEATSNVEGMDYVTLCTCTPYGVNTHRLLVRGHRIPYTEEPAEDLQTTIIQTVRSYYTFFLILGIIITVIGILIIRQIAKRHRKARS